MTIFPTGRAPPPSSFPRRAPSTSDNSNKPRVPPTNSASRAPTTTKAAQKPTESASSVASTGRTRDVQCHRCKGFGHVQRDCPNKRVLVVKKDGEYSSASDFDEDTYAMLAADHAGSEGEPEEHIGAEDAERYESLIVQRTECTDGESGAKSAAHVVPNKVHLRDLTTKDDISTCLLSLASTKKIRCQKQARRVLHRFEQGATRACFVSFLAQNLTTRTA